MNTTTIKVTGTDGIFADDSVFIEVSPLRWWARYERLSIILTKMGFSRAGGNPRPQEFIVIEANESYLIVEQV